MKYRQSFVCLLAFILSHTDLALAQSNAPVRGPFWSGTIRGPRSLLGGEAIAMKGIAVTVGADKNAYVCFDTDLLRVSLAWTGSFLNFGNTLTKIEWPPPPQVNGTSAFATKATPGWATGDSLADPRPIRQGPLPKDFAHYEGLYVNKDQVVFSYTVGKTKVLELPGFDSQEGQGIFTRTLNIAASTQPLTLAVCSLDGTNDTPTVPTIAVGDVRYVIVGKEKKIAVGVVGGPRKLHFSGGADDLRLNIPAHWLTTRMKLVISPVANDEAIARFAAYLKTASRPANLSVLCKGGPATWTETVVTKGVRGEDKDGYVVDTLTEPVNNPYNVKTFFGGFDFFPDGRAAICTFHGDVWVVSGIDDALEKLTWKRYAAGLFQPLGLKIVNGTIYVLGRDQITRLHDLNKDLETDFYENFNNDTIVTSNYHEFSLDLHTDSKGNFYFAKGAPWEPEVTSASQGCLFKVTKDGSKMEVVATGFRAPNGMTVGPRDEITVSDNEGHWMPSSKLNWIEAGGFYGMTPTAQRSLKLQRNGTNFVANPSLPEERRQFAFKAWNSNNREQPAPVPESYNQPVAWLPKNMDNSSGGQVWAASKKWGPLQDRLLFMSYGKDTLFEVMLDEVDGVKQAAMVQFPFRFNSGVMRGRVNPRDGQVYLSGLKGWQSAATRDGGFYRVRYTGQPVRMPTAFRATQDGLQITFATPVSAKSASDSGNYSIERWNYRWTGSYGSPEYSVDNPSSPKHDRPEIKSAKVSNDGKTVSLEIADMKPADQIKVRYNIEATDGISVTQEIYATVRKLGATANP